VIRGEFDPSAPYPKPWVRVLVYLEGHSPIWTEVRFLIDTGAGMTCLHPRDALSVGVPRRSLLRRQAWSNPPIHMSGVGGTMEYFETPYSYAFQTMNGDLHIIDRNILVARATLANTGLPALLGWDILRDFHLTVRQDTGFIELDPIVPNILQVSDSP
jgi:hypothetical protein